MAAVWLRQIVLTHSMQDVNALRKDASLCGQQLDVTDFPPLHLQNLIQAIVSDRLGNLLCYSDNYSSTEEKHRDLLSSVLIKACVKDNLMHNEKTPI